MKYYVRPFLHRRGTLVLGVLLLTVAVCFSAICFSAWCATVSQANAVNSNYVTIAVPAGMQEMKDGISYTSTEDGSYFGSDGSVLPSTQRMSTLLEGSAQVKMTDVRCLLGADVSGCTGITSGTENPEFYSMTFDQYAYNFSVLALRCTHVDTAELPALNGSAYPSEQCYTAVFEPIAPVSMMEVYSQSLDQSPILIQDATMCLPDGSIPFEAGKTYLVRGFYQDYPMIETENGPVPSNELGLSYSRNLVLPTTAGVSVMIEDDGSFRLWGGRDTPSMAVSFALTEQNLMYSYVPEGALPYWTEYEGDWSDFLDTAEGSVWRDEIIPLCDRNHSSATVILTDQVSSLYAFNTGDASITEGRMFSGEEYQGGSRVCLVSASYARLNGLGLGDSIPLDFYRCEYEANTAAHSSLSASVMEDVICRYPLLPEQRLNKGGNYTIVGIYNIPESAAGIHSLRADMIFIPKASVPDAAQYEDSSLPLLNSVILKNGCEEAFETEMKAQGLGGYFLYFDQEFEAASSSIAAAAGNAQRLLLLSLTAFLLAAGLFLLLSLRAFGPDVGVMRRLGIRAKFLRRGIWEILSLTALVSELLGLGLTALFHKAAMERLLQEAVAVRPLVLLLCGLAQWAILLLLSFVGASRTSNPKLMSGKGGTI